MVLAPDYTLEASMLRWTVFGYTLSQRLDLRRDKERLPRIQLIPLTLAHLKCNTREVRSGEFRMNSICYWLAASSWVRALIIGMLLISLNNWTFLWNRLILISRPLKRLGDITCLLPTDITICEKDRSSPNLFLKEAFQVNRWIRCHAICLQ